MSHDVRVGVTLPLAGKQMFAIAVALQLLGCGGNPATSASTSAPTPVPPQRGQIFPDDFVGPSGRAEPGRSLSPCRLPGAKHQRESGHDARGGPASELYDYSGRYGRTGNQS